MIRNDIPEPKLSNDFTIDDIHKICHWNYERFKNATTQERMEHYRVHTEKTISRLGLTNIKRLQIR
jgi:hypothetical protein